MNLVAIFKGPVSWGAYIVVLSGFNRSHEIKINHPITQRERVFKP